MGGYTEQSLKNESCFGAACTGTIELENWWDNWLRMIIQCFLLASL